MIEGGAMRSTTVSCFDYQHATTIISDLQSEKPIELLSYRFWFFKLNHVIVKECICIQ